MDRSNFLSLSQVGIFEGVLCKSQTGAFGNNLDGFDNSRVNFMFHTGVLSFSVFSDDYNVQILMSGLHSRDGEGVNYIGKQIQTLGDSHIFLDLSFVSGDDGAFENTGVLMQGA